MKICILILLLLVSGWSHIYSSQTKVTYDYSGNPLIYHIFLSLESGLGSDDYLKITLPLKIHSGTDKSVVKVKLISFSNNLQIISRTCDNYPVGSTTTLYYIKFNVGLTANKWYEIQLFPDTTPAAQSVSLPFNGLIQIQAISSLDTNAIIYDSNYAFRYITIGTTLASTGTMTVSNSSTSVQVNRVASIYTINIQLLPSLSNTNGGNFTIKIHYDSGNSVHTTASATGLLDFTFMGLCQSVTPSSGTAAVLNFCQISDDLTQITFSVNTVTAAQPIRIQTQISNPLYVSIRGIRAYYVDFISGIVKENGYQAVALSVNNIAITDLGNKRVYLFWGISTQNTDPQLASLNLGLYKATGSNVGPFNSFNAGFSFTETSPIDGRYRVKMYLGASGFLQGSIAHNLPAYSSLKVYCSYSTTTMYLTCQNVGPFINTNYRYFISGKVYYASGAGTSVVGFGNVQIIPIIYNSAGTQLTITLYSALASTDSLSLIDSKQYLDTSGYHNPSTYKIGVAKIVSYADDGTLSSTANAMKGLMTGTNSTIGIVPDLGVSQQLLLLMKVDSVAGGSGSGNQFKMRLLYNNKVIGFETDADSRGLDFVAYDNANAVWTIEYAPCHINGSVVCQKYNYDTPTKNIQIRTTDASGLFNYGLYKFDCAQAYTASPSCANGNCATACNLFTGYGTANSNAGVMSLRKVTFPSTSFHSSMYADENLMDFLVVFLQGTGFVSASLINAYTMVGAKMQNIKASYVNYFDYDTNNYNKGQRIPTMIRISGGVLPSQSRNASVVGVFFDDNIDARTFYTYKNKAYDVGCSTATCLYYPNTGINLPNNDIWHTMRRVQFYNIPPIQNQFNLLVPVTPSPTRFSYDPDPLPDTLTIAFFATNNSIGDATGLLTTLSVYRLFGTVVTGSISGAISNINGLSLRGSNYFGQYFNSYYPSSYSSYISYALNTSNIILSPPNNTFVYGYPNSFSPVNQYGCGVTITSLYYNIFSSSTVSFESPPANTATTCTLFGYIYNQQTAGQNPQRDGQWNYVAYCPIDSTFNLNIADANIKFINPQYPNVLTSNYLLRSIISYGVSNPIGQLQHYRGDGGNPSFTRSCTTAKLHPYNPSTSGTTSKQRATFTVSTPQIRMAPAAKYDGYYQFRVVITLPTTSNINMLSLCDISDPDLTCSASGGSSSITVTISYAGTGVITVTYFQLQLYATTSGALTAGDYTLVIYLPQYNSGTGRYMHFPDSFSNPVTYCTCTSNFKIGNTPYGTGMIFQTPVTTSLQKSTKSSFTFNFGSYDYRQAFFITTSYYKFDMGWMTQPAQTDRNTRNNFRCIVYQNNAGTLTISNKWKYLSFTAFNNIQLYSKYTIDQPKNYLFTLGCYGSGVPSLSTTSNMSLVWIDSGTNVQTATQIAAPTTLTTAAPTSLSVTLTNKRFNTQGMKAFYSFSITSTQALTQSTRIYFDFHFKLNSKLDNEGYVECYLRTAAAIVDTAAIFTYCQFTQDRQLVIWNNLAVSASTTIYIDIYNIQIPKSTDTSPNAITVSLDNDGDYSNGVAELKLITDTAAGGNAISDIKITSTSVNTNYIRMPQTITIKFDTITNVLTSGSFLYLLLPGPYGQWINRGQTLDTATACFLQADNAAGTNKLSACQFISKRILKMTLSAATSYNLHTVILTGIYSPSKVPDGRYNQYRFKLFMSTDSTQSDIIRFSFTDYSKHLTLIPDSTLIDLSWKYYSISVIDSFVSLTDISTQTFIIYIGYFSNVIQLRQSIYPNNFILKMTLTLTSHPVTNFIHKDGTLVELGVQNTYYRIAANSSVSAGLYTLQYSKTGDTSNKYTGVPPLTVVVSNKQCKLTTKQASYSLPKGGQTIPILISAMNCIPIADITITPTFSSAEVIMNTDLSSIVLTPTLADGNLYIVATHRWVALNIGDIVTVTFTITGTNAASYANIPSISLSIIDPAPYQTLPTATALAAPSLSYNKATFILQCTMASKIYWGLGIYPSILNTQALDFQARIISSSTGLMTNFTQPQDPYMRVYGVNYVLTTQTLSKTVYNLKSNSQYIFKYYCVNQMGYISDGQSITFNSLNYGAYLMKVFIIFRGSITYGQYTDLACSLALNFVVPHDRVMTQAMSICGGTRTPFYNADTDVINNQANSNGQYVYNFYILPDYTIPIDYTNANIRSALTLSSTSTTIITTSTYFATLPQLIQMQTQDIQFFASPVISITNIISGLNSIVATATITNMNGFIIIGCMNGVFVDSTMTMPTAAYIKKGMLSTNVTLLAVKMRYAIQNYNVTMSFSGLTDNKQYTFFYYATVEDPQISAESTVIRTFNAKTLEALTIDINFGVNLQVVWVLALFVILALL